MEFLHCNGCGFVPNGSGRGHFFLTSCGHVICDRCISQQTKNDPSCLVCKMMCRSVEIGPNAKPEIKSYFLDPMDLLKDSIRSTIQVMNFQRSQLKSYNYHVSKSMNSNALLEEENKRLKEQLTLLQNEIDTFKRSNQQPWAEKNLLGSKHNTSFMVNTTEPTLVSMFGHSIAKIPKQESPLSIVGEYSRPLPGNSNTGLRLSHLGPGRLTIPYTPQKSQSYRKASSGYGSIGSRGPGSVFSCSGHGNTPDITSRLRHLRCIPGTGTTPNEHNSQRQYP